MYIFKKDKLSSPQIRFIIFLLIFFTLIDLWVFFQHPKNRLEKGIKVIEKSYLEDLSHNAVINQKNVLVERELIDTYISAIRLDQNLLYFAVDHGSEIILYPPGIFSLDSIKHLPLNNINKFGKINVLSLKYELPSKYNSEITTYYIGINPQVATNFFIEGRKEAQIFIFLSIVIYAIITIMYFLIHRSILGTEISVGKELSYRMNNRMANNIKELKTTNALLAKALKSKDILFKLLSHDLKAPLRNVNGLVDSIVRKYSSKLDLDVLDRLSRIQKNIDKEQEMISDILRSFKKSQSSLPVEKIDLNDILNSIEEELQFELQEKNVNIKIRKKLPILSTNYIIIRHVFLNLIDNSCKFFKDEFGNQIDINYSINKNEYIISVRDNGIGIPSSKQEQIFEFNESNRIVSSRDLVGNGLGLPLVYALLEIIDGKIWLDGSTENGTTFYVSLAKVETM